MSRTYTVREVACLYGVKIGTVRGWIREGRLGGNCERFRMENGQFGYRIVVSEEDLDNFEIDSYLQIRQLNTKLTKAERERHLGMLDELEEQLYDTACLIEEMRERLRKIEL